MGHFFQIWSLAISLHISCSVRFDAVVCNQLSTENLEFSGEKHTGQNLTINTRLSAAPADCPATRTTSVTEIRRKLQRWIFCETSLLRNSSLILSIGQNNLVLLISTLAGQVYFFFQKYMEE